MENTLPDFVNKKRRKSLTKYSALAILVYHVPLGIAFLARFMEIAQYDYRPVIHIYLAMVIANIATHAAIQLKGQITLRFITITMYFQVVVSFILMMFTLYVMKDLSYLILVTCFIVLIFVFIQSRLLVSFSVIAIVTLAYLAISYLNSIQTGQSIIFGKDILMAIVFIPSSTFIAYMCGIVQKQHREIKQSRDKIKTTFLELEETHLELESFNQRMLESMHYAEMIQRSLLPGIDRMKTESPNSLIIWMPKDIVGGDIFFTCTYQGSTIIALMDCTGHGVPGAFLTMIAYMEIRKIILEDACHDPSGILGRLNRSMKTVLYKNGNKNMADDGLDAAVVNINHQDRTIRYAGSHIPLFYIENNELTMVKADKHSLGYQHSDEHFVFKNHTIKAGEECFIYLKTDGFTDQMGGEKNLRFTTGRFKHLIMENHQKPFDIQRKKILGALTEYMGQNEQRDDITVIGLKI
ncbi:MAG: serine/threonine-protein phosphatase [Proteobacteria bacterium]|nr:serine/threonine-protein phosphatase [Pseudomonadota bacterium]